MAEKQGNVKNIKTIYKDNKVKLTIPKGMKETEKGILKIKNPLEILPKY